MEQEAQRRITLKVSPELSRRLRTEAARAETTLNAQLNRWLEVRLDEPARPSDPAWRERLRSAMNRLRRPGAEALPPKEIEREITLARQEVPELRRAGRS